MKQILFESFTPEERDTFKEFVPYLSRNPRRIKRIINIYRIVRLLMKMSDLESIQKTIKWIILSEQWPVRCVLIMEKIEKEFQLETGVYNHREASIVEIYDKFKIQLTSGKLPRIVILDAEEELFYKFITSNPILTVDNIFQRCPFSFNLNPAVIEEVHKLQFSAQSGQ